MDTLFILGLVFLIFCFIFRKRLTVFLTDHRDRNKNAPAHALIPAQETQPWAYSVLAYNAKDYDSTKDLENMMETRLERCLTGLLKQGYETEVELHSTGFVIVYLVKYRIQGAAYGRD